MHACMHACRREKQRVSDLYQTFKALSGAVSPLSPFHLHIPLVPVRWALKRVQCGAKLLLEPRLQQSASVCLRTEAHACGCNAGSSGMWQASAAHDAACTWCALRLWPSSAAAHSSCWICGLVLWAKRTAPFGCMFGQKHVPAQFLPLTGLTRLLCMLRALIKHIKLDS